MSGDCVLVEGQPVPYPPAIGSGEHCKLSTAHRFVNTEIEFDAF